MLELTEVHQYAVIVDKEKNVLWLKSKGGKKKLMFPGGTLEKGEDLKESLKREVKEETGLDIDIIDLIQADLIPKEPKQLALVYLCSSELREIKLSKEHDEFVWENPDKINVQEVAHPGLVDVAKKAVRK